MVSIKVQLSALKPEIGIHFAQVDKPESVLGGTSVWTGEPAKETLEKGFLSSGSMGAMSGNFIYFSEQVLELTQEKVGDRICVSGLQATSVHPYTIIFPQMFIVGHTNKEFMKKVTARIEALHSN